MQVLLTGHAGLLVRAGGVTVLWDPWLSPAELGSGCPVPENADHDVAGGSSPADR